MVRRTETESESDPIDRDERLGEAIEAYLALAEGGQAPDPETFAARYPDLGDDLRSALDGLALVRGLVGEAEGPGHRLESGRRIAGYRIVRELGRGGMGTVYEAVHVGLDRPVALKVLGAHAAPDSTGRRRFLNEARTAAGLHHTHIVPVFDVGQVGGLCYYAMQRIEGSGLDSVLRHLRRDRSVAAGSSTGGTTPGPAASSWWGRSLRRLSATGPLFKPSHEQETGTWFGASWSGGEVLEKTKTAIGGRDGKDEAPPFDPPRGAAYYRWVAEVGRQAAEALAHAHRRGIIHRDVKPSNLLVDARGTIWVADFGLARRLADPGLTHHDSLLGTPRYMSPEQARTGPIDGRTDVYSLGATLYELLTLRPPFQGKTAVELVDQIGGRDPSPPRQSDPRIPRDLETIVLKCLAKRPADRYASALELAEDLERFLNLEPVRARRISPVGRLWRLARRNPATSAISAAAAATVLVVATAAYVRVVHERDLALSANAGKEAAIKEAVEANNATRAEMRMHLLSEAKLARHSTALNRRSTGLGLLKEAATLDPEPALRAELRNELVEFLVLRDIEARPEFNTGPMRGIVFGAEGARLAALSQNGREFSLWDVATRKRLERHQLDAGRLEFGAGPGPGGGPPGGRRRGWTQAGITAVGQCIAVVRPDGQGLRLFDATTGAPIRNLEMPGRRVLSVLAAPDGHRLVTLEDIPRGGAGGGREVCLYDPEQVALPLATLAHWENVASAPGRNPLVAIAPDGKTVATSRFLETTVALWSAEDGRSLGTIESPDELNALALGPFGLLATSGIGGIRLWETLSNTPLSVLTPNQSFIRLLRFNPRGTLLAAAGMGTNVEVWDPASHEAVAVLHTPDRPEDLAFSPDGRTLAAAGEGATTTAWAVVDPLARARLSGFDSPPTSLAFNSDDLLAIGSLKGVVRFWQPGHCPSATQQVKAPGAQETPADHPGDGLPTALTFDRHGKLITVDSERLRLWTDPPEGASPAEVRLPRIPGGAWGRISPSAIIARDATGQTLFVARGGRVLAWHADDPKDWHDLALPEPSDRGRRRGDPFERFRGRGEPPPWRTVMGMAASPAADRLYLITNGGLPNSSEVLALALDGDKARRLDWNLGGGVTSLALSPDGETLAVGDRLGTIALVDTAQGAVRTRFSLLSSETERRTWWALAFSPDSRALAIGTQQGTIEIWSVHDTSAPRLRLPGHRGFVASLAYDPKGRYLASIGSDKVVQVWDLQRVREELDRHGLGW